jgi:hypothetical protein
LFDQHHHHSIVSVEESFTDGRYDTSNLLVPLLIVGLNNCLTLPSSIAMAGRFFTAAVLFAAAFASDNSTASNSDNSTASTFSYDVPADEVANTPASDDYGTYSPFSLNMVCIVQSMRTKSLRNRPRLLTLRSHTIIRTTTTIWRRTCERIPPWISLVALGIQPQPKVVAA